MITEVIRQETYKLNANKIEAAILSLPQIAEVMVIGIFDANGKDFAAAIIKPAISPKDLSLQRLHSLLRDKNLIHLFEMPAIMRLLERYAPPWPVSSSCPLSLAFSRHIVVPYYKVPFTEAYKLLKSILFTLHVHV